MSNLVLVILSIFIPPLAIFLKTGISKTFWINLILTIFFFFPGVIHAVYTIGIKSK